MCVNALLFYVVSIVLDENGSIDGLLLDFDQNLPQNYYWRVG